MRTADAKPVGPWWRRRVPLGALAIAVVAVLLVGELSARVLDGGLPPERGPLQELLVKDQQVHALAKDGRIDVLFAGSSTTDAGVDPDRFDDQSKVFDRSYNAALKGMPIRLQGEWLDQVLPELKPKVLVLDLQPTLVIVPQGEAAAGYLNSLNSYQSWLRTTSDQPLARLDRWFSARSTLVKDRQRFQQPSLVARAVANRVTGKDPGASLDEDTRGWVLSHTTELGRTLDYREAPDAVVQDRSLATKFNEVLGWKFDLDDADALIRSLEKKGITVVLSIMPIDVPTLSNLGLKVSRYTSAVDRIKALAKRRDVPVLELGTDLDPLDYHDKVHIADPGSAKVTDELARRIDALCADGACDHGS